MDDKKILITGATGLVGSYVSRLLYESGYQQISATRRSGSDTSILGELSAKIIWHEGNLTDVGFIQEIVSDKDWIIHCAGYVGHGTGQLSQLMEANVIATERLTSAALAAGTGKFLHVSSIAALGRSEKKQLISEENVWKRSKFNSPYANSKYLSEMEVWRAHAEGLPVAIVNPSVVLGAGKWGSSSLVLFDKVWNGLRFFPKGSTGFVDVRDVAQIILQLLISNINGERVIANASNLSFREVFNQIAGHFDKKEPAIAVNGLMTEISWRMSNIISTISGKAPFVEKSAARLSQYSYHYENDKSGTLLDFAYRDIKETLSECCAQYLESREKNIPFGILPF